MRIVFASNYYNHHQAPLCAKLSELTHGNFTFIECEEMEQERKNMGWGEKEVPSYVIQIYGSDYNYQNALKLLDEADMVLYGWSASDLLLERLKKGKLTFLYSERVFKTGYELWKLPIRWFTWHKYYGQYKNHYLLCASAYASGDFALTLNFTGKAYKWGYFPKTKRYAEVETLIAGKEKQSIIWVARMLDWKHPEVPVEIARRLKEDGYQYKLRMIGNGEMEQHIRHMVKELQLEDTIEIFSSMSPDEVRNHMEKSELFLFTSDFYEGWGAVLNEAMNSACGVIASHAIGAAPYLINDGVNGYLYEDGNVDQLYERVKDLLTNNDRRREMAFNAYATVVDEWNSDQAAQRLIDLTEQLLKGNGNIYPYGEGLCSKAPIVYNSWYKTKKQE